MSYERGRSSVIRKNWENPERHASSKQLTTPRDNSPLPYSDVLKPDNFVIESSGELPRHELFPYTDEFLAQQDPRITSIVIPVLSDIHFLKKTAEGTASWRKNARSDLLGDTKGKFFERATTLYLESIRTDGIRIVHGPMIDEIMKDEDWKEYLKKYHQRVGYTTRPDLFILQPMYGEDYTLLKGGAELFASDTTQLSERKMKQFKLHGDETLLQHVYTDPRHSNAWRGFFERKIMEQYPELPQQLMVCSNLYNPLVVTAAGEPKPDVSSNTRVMSLPMSRGEINEISVVITDDLKNLASNITTMTHCADLFMAAD